MTLSARPIVVVLGMMGRTPFAGVAWQVLHYLEGFRRLGFDVYYIEDTGDWPYDPEQNSITDDCRYTTSYIARQMAWLGMAEKWGYRAASQDNRVFGLSEEHVASLWRRAVALVNLTGATVPRDEHMQVDVRIFLETDPVLPQIEVAQNRDFTIQLLAAHTHHFSYGENLGAPDCGVPVGRFRYFPTRQPIVLDWWRSSEAFGSRRPPLRFTTIGSWQQSGKDITWNGETYLWSKHHEFLKVIDLPRRTNQVLELALACDDRETLERLKANGWRVTDALALSRNNGTYRDYICGSDGEFTVAKDQNIRLRSGWFSDRSASYLAAGKPVITQDTAFGNILPTGRGLFAFRTVDDVLGALDAIATDYEGHQRAALAIAEEYFDAVTVCRDLAEQAGLEIPAGHGSSIAWK